MASACDSLLFKGMNKVSWILEGGIWTRNGINMVAEPGDLPQGMEALLARIDTMDSKMTGIEEILQNKLDSMQLGIEVALQRISGYVEGLTKTKMFETDDEKFEIPGDIVKANGDTGIDIIKIQKLEGEEQEEDEDKEEKEEDGKEGMDQLTFEEGIQGKLMMKGLVKKWFVDKGYGFLDIKGFSVFCHADKVVGQDWLRVGGSVWVKVMEDLARGKGSWKAVEAWDPIRWRQELARREAQRAVDVAAKASRIACKSVEKGKRMMEMAEDARLRINIPPRFMENSSMAKVEGIAEQPKGILHDVTFKADGMKEKDEGIKEYGMKEKVPMMRDAGWDAQAQKRIRDTSHNLTRPPGLDSHKIKGEGLPQQKKGVGLPHRNKGKGLPQKTTTGGSHRSQN